MNWLRGLETIARADAPLCEHTWYGLGGPARWLLCPRSEDELATILKRTAEHDIPWRVLGRGANILVREQGFDGAVIKLQGPTWETLRFDEPHVHAGAGVDFPRLVRQTIEHGLVGLECLAGIPGTVGGVIRMNAGGHQGCVADFLHQARLIMPDGTSAQRNPSQLGLGYRTSDLRGGIITTATFTLQPGDSAAAMERFRHAWNKKYATQPPVSAKSAGCIFKNPHEHAAGALLDQAGLKGTRVGGAEISRRHANFILAHPGASAGDVVDLIALAKDRVQSETGIELELEVEIW